MFFFSGGAINDVVKLNGDLRFKMPKLAQIKQRNNVKYKTHFYVFFFLLMHLLSHN